MPKTFTFHHFPVIQKDYGTLLALSKSTNGAQLLAQGAISAIKEGNPNFLFCLFKYKVFFEKLLAFPNLLQAIFVSMPTEYEEFLLEILSQRKFLQALLSTQQAPEYLKDLAKAHPILQKAAFKYPVFHDTVFDDPLEHIYRDLLNNKHAAEFICNIAILNREFAETLFENHHTKENYRFVKALEIMSSDVASIEFFLKIIQAHNLSFYIQKAIPGYQVDFCKMETELICRTIFHGFTSAYLDNIVLSEQNSIFPAKTK